MSGNVEKSPSQVLRAQDDILKLLVLSDQQSETQRFSNYSDIKQQILTGLKL